MIKTKYFSPSSSISVSFASVFLFSTLFAVCCFTFLYLQPLQDNGSDDRVHDELKLLNSPPSSNPRTRMDSLPNPPSSTPMVEDLVNSNSPEVVLKEDEDGHGLLKEPPTVDSTAPSSTTMVVVEDVNSTSDPPNMVEDGNHEGIMDEIKVANSNAQAKNSIAPTTMVEDGNHEGLIEQEVNSAARVNPIAPTTMVENRDHGLIEQEVNSTGDPLMKKEEDGPGEDANKSTPAVVEDLFSPPFNVSPEERMAWFKERVPRMKIFESTKKTRMYDQRIQEFFKGCKVRFFMTWISPSGLFGKREMFSLESVLKAHPKGCVVIVSRSMDSKAGRELLKPLVKLGYKVLPVSPDLSLLFTNTPAGPWLEGLKAGEFDPGMIPITQNLSNLLRLVLLYNYGGIYIDVDVIVIKDVSELKNCVGIQTVDEPAKIWTSLNNAVLIFDKKHPLLLKLIEEFTAHFNGNVWGHNGPYMVSRVVMRVAFNDPAYDFNIMSPTAFYPVDWIRIPKYFRRPKDDNETQWTYDEDFVLKKRSYAIHLWNKFSRRLKIEEHSLIGRLISDHCILCKDIYDTDSTTTSS